jgi:mRNA interferase RelE/StbE
MATYRVEWKPSAIRELKRLDRQVVPRIVAAVESLGVSPYPSGVRKLHGGERTYRIRVGEYRVIYEIFDLRLTVHVVRVRHRKDAYRE